MVGKEERRQGSVSWAQARRPIEIIYTPHPIQPELIYSPKALDKESHKHDCRDTRNIHQYTPIHTRSRVSNFLPVRVSITIPSVLNKVLSYEPKNSFIKAGGDSSFFLPFLHRFGCKLLLAIRIRNSINYKQLETFTETTTSFRSKQNYELYKYTWWRSRGS